MPFPKNTSRWLLPLVCLWSLKLGDVFPVFHIIVDFAIAGDDITHWKCTLVTSLNFPNLALKIVFALSHPSVLSKGQSIRALTFEITNSLNYENLLQVIMSSRSISVLNWPQNFNQSKFVPSNLLIMNFRSFTFTESLLTFLPLFHSGFFFQMIVKVQSSGFQIAISHHIFVQGTLPQSDLLLIFCLHFLFISILLFRFEAFLLPFSYASASCLFDHSSICSLLLSLCKIFSWSLLFKLSSSFIRYSIPLRCVSNFFLEAMVKVTLDRWSNRRHFFLGA